MGSLNELFETLLIVFKSIEIMDIVDIALVSYLIYKAAKLVKETRAEQLVKGILLLVVLFAVSVILELKTIEYLLTQLFSFGVFAILIVFQPELRRILEQVGRTKITKLNVFAQTENNERQQEEQTKLMIDAVTAGANFLSIQRTGALMVIEMETKLGEYIKTGTIINAVPSVEMLGNVFFPNSPLHDGALIIRHASLYCAGCFLPLSSINTIKKELGSRHRAALGMSENSDAIVIVVSEETGNISVARRGELTRNFSQASLKEYLCKQLMAKDEDTSENKKSIFKKIKVSGQTKNKSKKTTKS